MDKSREFYSREGDNSSRFEGKKVAWEHTIAIWPVGKSKYVRSSVVHVFTCVVRISRDFFLKKICYNLSFSIDATFSKRQGRFANDAGPADENQNAHMRTVYSKRYNRPFLALFANRDILNGEEVRYDYNDKDLPWRVQVQIVFDLRIWQTVWWMIWCWTIFQPILSPILIFQWKLIFTFNQHCLNYRISNRL